MGDACCSLTCCEIFTLIHPLCLGSGFKLMNGLVPDRFKTACEGLQGTVCQKSQRASSHRLSATPFEEIHTCASASAVSAEQEIRTRAGESRWSSFGRRCNCNYDLSQRSTARQEEIQVLESLVSDDNSADPASSRVCEKKGIFGQSDKGTNNPVASLVNKMVLGSDDHRLLFEFLSVWHTVLYQHAPASARQPQTLSEWRVASEAMLSYTTFFETAMQ